MITTEALQAELEQYTGTETYTPISMRLWATDGAIAFARKAEAFWLLQTIDSLLRYTPEDDFYDVKLLVKNSSGVISIGNGNRHVYLTHAVPFTDCPEGEWEFFVEQMDDHRWCLLLPSEH